MRWTNACARWLRRAAMLAVAGLTVIVPLVLATTARAEAHAVVSGTDPADGARLAVAPDRVAISLETKQPTVEGDPLQVYGPDGERIDTGDVRALDIDPDEPAATLSVGLRTDLPHPDGDYRVVYRVISADTHLVAGQFTFRCGPSAPRTGSTRMLESEPVAVRPPRSPRPLVPGWPADRWHWPKAAFLASLATSALGALVCGRHRGATSVAWSEGTHGLVTGRRLD